MSIGLGIGAGSGAVTNRLFGVLPELTRLTGSGYAGSTYGTNRPDVPLLADGVPIWDWTGGNYTQTTAHEGKALSQAGSNVIPGMWTPARLDAGLKTNGAWWRYLPEHVTVASGKATETADLFGTRPQKQANAAQQAAYDASGKRLVFAGNHQGYRVDTAFSPEFWIGVQQFGDGTPAVFNIWNTFVGDASNTRISGDSEITTNAFLRLNTVSNGVSIKNGVTVPAGAAVLPMPKSSLSVRILNPGTARRWGVGLGDVSATSWVGDRYEDILLSSYPDATTLALLQGYIHHANNIAASLPTDHPRKLASSMELS